MIKFLLFFVVSSLTCIVAIIYIAGVEMLSDWFAERDRRKKRCKEIDELMKIYKAAYEDETDDILKGYWLAMLMNLHYERKCLR